MCSVFWNVTDSEADVIDLGDLKLIRLCVAPDRQYDDRGPADAARNGRLEVLQRHGVDASIASPDCKHPGSMSCSLPVPEAVTYALLGSVTDHREAEFVGARSCYLRGHKSEMRNW